MVQLQGPASGARVGSPSWWQWQWRFKLDVGCCRLVVAASGVGILPIFVSFQVVWWEVGLIVSFVNLRCNGLELDKQMPVHFSLYHLSWVWSIILFCFHFFPFKVNTKRYGKSINNGVLYDFGVNANAQDSHSIAFRKSKYHFNEDSNSNSNLINKPGLVI